MRNRGANAGVVRVLSTLVVLISSVSFCALNSPVAFSHSGDNEAFLRSDGSSGPQEITVDQQGMKVLNIKTATAELQRIRQSLKTTGEVKADETRAFIVNPPVAGVVQSVLAKQEDLVHKGQVLAVVHSVEVANSLTQLMYERTKLTAEIARIKTQYTSDITLQQNEVDLAKGNFDREESLLQQGITARKNQIEAKNRYDSSKVKLATLKQRLDQEVKLLSKQLQVTTETVKGQLKIMGIPEADVEDALVTGKVETNLAIRAPVTGYVVKREITLGERVDPSQSVFSIVDLDPIWVMVNVYQEQIPDVKEGQPVLLETPAKERLSGKISTVGSTVDATTKTIHVRIVADNPKGNLRPGMFVTAEILLGRSNQTGLLVPEASIVYYQERPYVYLHDVTEGTFEPKAVKLGVNSNGEVEILSGVQAGDLVVVSGASQLLAQSILKPGASHQHEGEKHDDHAKHEAQETRGASLPAQTVIGFAIGLVVASAIFVIGLIATNLRKGTKA